MADFNLTASMRDGKLYISLSGRVASQNVAELETRLTAERKNHPNGSVVFDCEGLVYISSAGLRVLLTFNKKENAPIKIINVSPEAYEIFDITGFTEIFEVSKKLRDISNAAVRKMGTAGSITVYYIGDDTLLKVYPYGTKLETIEHERQFAQVAMLLEIPTLIAYDIVTFNGHYGMLYELAKANTVFSVLENEPVKLNFYATEMGKLLRQIHKADPQLDIIPKARENYIALADEMGNWLHPQEVKILKDIICSIPDTDNLLYNNFSARNVFVQQNGELILINMLGITSGNPIYDLGKIYMFYRNNDAEMTKRLTGFESFQAQKLWLAMMLGYFNTTNLAVVNQLEEKFEAAASLISAVYPASYRKTNGVDLSIDDIEFFVSRARRDVFPSTYRIQNVLSSKD